MLTGSDGIGAPANSFEDNLVGNNQKKQMGAYIGMYGAPQSFGDIPHMRR